MQGNVDVVTNVSKLFFQQKFFAILDKTLGYKTNKINEDNMKYKFLLFDADNTVLDFDKAEENALYNAFAKYGLPYDQHVLTTYKRNNLYMWQQLELGLADKPTVRDKRFRMTFDELGLDVSDEQLVEISRCYEDGLHHGFAVIDHAEEVLQQLIDDGHTLILVSNGFLSVQVARMKGSGMGKYFPIRFISEQVGYSKPQKEFFDYAFDNIDGFEPSQAIIIGDSLTSDIQGGVNAGIATCWYNPNHAENTRGVRVDYEISDLRQLYEIV